MHIEADSLPTGHAGILGRLKKGPTIHSSAWVVPGATVMGELVTVGHTAVVHACKIDNEVLVGMGAIILDDVEVGARSIIGANALVTIGMKIPPGSLVLGSPAKIRRQLTLDEQKDIARWAWSYVETAKQYREFY